MTRRVNPLDRYAADIAPGELTWIGVRPRRREPLQSITSTKAVATLGLEGDHRMGKTPDSGRQVTIISEEFIAQIERHLNRTGIDPGALRRNLVVKGLNLNALRRQRFRFVTLARVWKKISARVGWQRCWAMVACAQKFSRAAISRSVIRSRWS